MTWLTWRQFRTQTLVTVTALAATAVILGITGPHLAHLFDTEIAACLARGGSNACPSDTLNGFRDTYGLLQHFFGYTLIVIPGLIGAFWGAPLLTREIEAGTHRLVWNQSVTRTRWLAVKVGLISLISALAAGLFSLMLTWWSSPLDRVNANRITPPVFDQRGIDPIGWALFAFALGVAVGILTRRTLAAMATTLGIFIAVRLLWPLFVRPSYLIPPMHKTARIGTLPYDWVGVNSGPDSPMVVHVSMPGAWVLSDHTVNAAGHQVLGSTLFPLCPPPAGSVGKHAPDSCFIHHLIQLGYNRSVLTYQPASRFWLLQASETGILVAVALLLAMSCYWWVRRGKVT